MQTLTPDMRPALELHSTNAIVAVVAEGLGVSVMRQPRSAFLQTYAGREVDQGTRAPWRRIALAWRSSDDDGRNLQAVAATFGAIFWQRTGRA